MWTRHVSRDERLSKGFQIFFSYQINISFTLLSDGQSVAYRIKGQLEKSSKLIDTTITRYNNNNFKTEYMLPKQILRMDAVNVEHDMYYVQDEVCKLMHHHSQLKI